jgi:hypothetical protein
MGPRIEKFRGSIRGPQARCVRFAALVAHATTQHSLPVVGQTLPGRIDYLPDSYGRFPMSRPYVIFPLPRALLGATIQLVEARCQRFHVEVVHKALKLLSFVTL